MGKGLLQGETLRVGVRELKEVGVLPGERVIEGLVVKVKVLPGERVIEGIVVKV